MRSTTSPVMSWFFGHVLQREPSRFLDLSLATMAVGATAILRAWLLADTAPWFLFVAVILALALLLGRVVGVYATILSALLVAYAIGSRADPYWLSQTEWIASGVFIASTLGIVALAAELRAAFRTLNALMEQREVDLKKTAEREEFLASVLASSPDCIKVLTLDGQLTYMSDGGMDVMEVSDFNAIKGCPWPDFWQGELNREAREAVEAAARGEVRHFIGKADTMKGNPRWWHVAVGPIRGEGNKPERILSVSRDITASRRNEEERDRLARIIEHSSDFIGMARLDGSVFFVNEAARKLVGLEPEDVSRVTVEEFFPPEQAAEIPDLIFPAVAKDGYWSGERLFRHFKTGELIPVLYTVFPVQDATGELIGFGTVTRDFRDRKRAEEQQQILNHELSHRLKNAFAMVLSIATQTLRSVSDQEPVDAFERRIYALSSAHDILLQQEWTSAPLANVADAVLGNLADVDRFNVAGPPISLGSSAALSASLLLHELGTNAAKYGALSAGEGRVDVTWRIDGEDDGQELVLDWIESGGPIVTAPTRRGFGSRLIRLGLTGTGGVSICYPPSGVRAEMRAPLEQVGLS